MGGEVAAPSAAGTPVYEKAVPVVKATFIGKDGTVESNVVQTDQDVEELFKAHATLAPPLDPEVLCHIYEVSGALVSNIEAYKTNIDGFGHAFKPVIDLDDPELEDKVREALFVENVMSLETGDDDVDALSAAKEPTAAEIKERIELLRREMMREKIRLQAFFKSASVECSFSDLRQRMRQDLETQGNAYWEILRNAAGEPCQINYAPAQTIRLKPLDPTPVEVEVQVQQTFLNATTEVVKKRFRLYVQVVNYGSGDKRVTYFKQFGDPRVYSSATGNQYESADAMKKKEPGVREATELYHFKIHNARGPYGLPRWAAELISVLGNRHAQEVNLAFFENRSVPPMAIMVSGGRLTEEVTDRLQNFIKNEIKGHKNAHKIMVLEAETNTVGAINNGQTKIEMVPLMHLSPQDGQHLQYMQMNRDVIGEVFRVPRLLRGDMKDFNKSSAIQALKFCEQQVFKPNRNSFDWTMSHMLLPELGVQYWEFLSRGPDFADNEELIKALEVASKWGMIIPDEARDIAGPLIFGRDLKKVQEPWAHQPMLLTTAGVPYLQGDDQDREDGEERGDQRAGAAQSFQPPATRRQKSVLADHLLALKRRFAAEDAQRIHENAADEAQ